MLLPRKLVLQKKTLYRFVKNREDLIEKIVARWTDNFTPVFEREANSAQQVINLLKLYLFEIADKSLSIDAVGLFKLLQSDFPHCETFLNKYQQSGIERSRVILANWFEHQYQQGFLKKMDFHIISELVISMVIAEPLRKMALGILPPLPETDITPRINAALKLLEHGIVEK